MGGKQVADTSGVAVRQSLCAHFALQLIYVRVLCTTALVGLSSVEPPEPLLPLFYFP